MSQFQDDLAKAKPAEELALSLFRKRGAGYKFEDISNNSQFYHKGDILATDLATGKEYFIDVKADEVIGKSKNILCEECNVWKNDGGITDGFMYFDYDYLAVVSQIERKIYIIDFEILKSIYRRGEYKTKNHPDNICHFFLIPLYVVKRHNALIAELAY